MKILVTGVTGFIGKAVADALIAKGHEVTVQGRNAKNASNYATQVIQLLKHHMILRHLFLTMHALNKI